MYGLDSGVGHRAEIAHMPTQSRNTLMCCDGLDVGHRAEVGEDDTDDADSENGRHTPVRPADSEQPQCDAPCYVWTTLTMQLPSSDAPVMHNVDGRGGGDADFDQPQVMHRIVFGNIFCSLNKMLLKAIEPRKVNGAACSPDSCCY